MLHAQKNIIDANELVSLQKSGFPDTVQLQQVCDAEEEMLRARALQEEVHYLDKTRAIG